MGRCATCGKRVGVFARTWRRIDRAKHCTECAPGVMARRRQSTLDAIRAGSPPRVALAAAVISRDLDHPANHRRYTGVILLTDKGVIFAQHGEYKKAQSGGALFGVLGSIYDAAVEKGRREAASVGLDDVEKQDAGSLMDRAEQLFLFQIGDIRGLKGSGSCLEIRAAKGRTVFRWTNARQSIKPRRLLLDAYVSAVNTGRDVMADCSQFIQI